MATPKYMVFNGDVVPFADAKVHIASPAVKYGIGVFEGVRGYWNEQQRQLYVFRLREHMERLKQSMKLLRLEDNYSLEDLEDGLLRMIRANEFRTTIQM
ncbi:MAG: aminotransferase class IV, partial [Alphaproteobacteria bacterium]